MAYHFVPSIRGKEKLIHDGFVYRHQRSRGRTHYFVCEEQACPGRAILRGVEQFNELGGEIQRSVNHSHPIREERGSILKTLSNITKEGASTTNPPSAIVQSQRTKIHPKLATRLPSEEALRQRIRRQRKKKYPREPQSLGQIDIPQNLRNTISDPDKEFVFLDDPNDTDLQALLTKAEAGETVKIRIEFPNARWADMIVALGGWSQQELDKSKPMYLVVAGKQNSIDRGVTAPAA